MEDLAESYFSSQRQAYRTHRAMIEKNGIIVFYPSESNVSNKEPQNEKFKSLINTGDFRDVENVIRISCTGGNFWIAREGGIADNMERELYRFKSKVPQRKDSFGNKKANRKNKNAEKDYIADFIEERNRLLSLVGDMRKAVQLNRLFLSFDKPDAPHGL